MCEITCSGLLGAAVFITVKDIVQVSSKEGLNRKIRKGLKVWPDENMPLDMQLSAK